jgi:hypothetical protein
MFSFSTELVVYRFILGVSSTKLVMGEVAAIAPSTSESSASKKPLTLANQGLSFGAGEMNRTPDLLITNELLYRLSYTGVSPRL